jgi:hypothetical protein
MKAHQKYFHMLDAKGKLLPAFISVANIESSDLSVIVDGNERVIRHCVLALLYEIIKYVFLFIYLLVFILFI